MPRAKKYYNFNYNYTVFTADTEEYLQSLITKYHVYSLETCPTTGRQHIQGFVVFPNQRYVSALRNQFFNDRNGSGYLDYCGGDSIQNLDYSTKEGEFWESGTRPLTSAEKGIKQTQLWESFKVINRTGNQDDIPYYYYIHSKRNLDEDRLKHRKRPKLTTAIQDVDGMYQWQQDLYVMVQGTPDPRKVIWVCDPQGNKGKTEMWRFLLNEGAFPIAAGKTADIAFSIPDEGASLFVMDLTREKESTFCYSILEQVKNGHVFSSKYHSQWKHFPTPHVVIFSNFEPDYSKMSEDRWCVMHI